MWSQIMMSVTGQGMGGAMMGGGLWMILWSLFWIVLLAAVVVLVWRLVRGRRSPER